MSLKTRTSERTALLVGDGMKIAFDVSRVDEMKVVAKNLGLRLLVPVHPPAAILLQCEHCQRVSLSNEMLADLTGEPFKAYIHRTCAEGLK